MRLFCLQLLLVLPILAVNMAAAPSWSATVEAVPDGFPDAVNQYNTKHYNLAIKRLNQVLATKPNHVMSHYYLALSYQAVNQIGSARAEYTWINQHTVDSRLRYNAQVALSQINQWSQRRAYAGNGNIFQYQTGGPSSGGSTTGGPRMVRPGPTMVRT